MIYSVELIEVVKIEHTAGKGTADDPVRAVADYWTREGVLLATIDGCQPSPRPLPCQEPERPS